MDIRQGDRVQIVNGGIDVTNGNHARAGSYYGENGPLWATVDLIDYEWKTGSKFGLPAIVTKVRCSNNGVVVWQVRPEDIAPNIIHASQPETVQVEPTKPEPKLLPTSQGTEDLSMPPVTYYQTQTIQHGAYAPASTYGGWGSGITTGSTTKEMKVTTSSPRTKYIGGADPFTTASPYFVDEESVLGKLTEEQKQSVGPNMTIDETAKVIRQETAWRDPGKRRRMLNEDVENIQNSESFPIMAKPSQNLLAARYDYQIIPGDNRYTISTRLEDKLMEARASLGLPVHGNNNIAKAIKYYLYNRFKSPDINLAHSKSTTHVFFTRPDLYLLDGLSANAQTLSHPESAMIWRHHPEIFKLLTDYKKCGDSDNNFNLLLSNQVTSFNITDEKITTIKDGKSWNDYEMMYGDQYDGRTAGEFTCDFAETSDYSIIHMLKLWISYIDNVARGAWSPSYANSGPTSNHVFTKTLDYGASAYVFKCAPDGETILYWSKYFGVFPTNTGAGALSWNNTSPIGDDNKLSIIFGYSYKKDLSPISLLSFNDNAAISSGGVISENSFSHEYNHSSRPFVGAPFIEFNLNENPTLSANTVNYGRANSSIKLKFRPVNESKFPDSLLYRYGPRN